MAFVFTAMLTGCTTLSLRPYDADAHASAATEWAPHRDAAEWWYVTGVLSGEDKLWMFQFTIFHRANFVSQGYLLDIALSDYQTGQHIFEETATANDGVAHGDWRTIAFGGSSITLDGSTVTVTAVGEKLSYSFVMKAETPPIWNGRGGAIGMGVAKSPTQMSYYYSFPRMSTSGTVSYVDASGSRVSAALTGSSWLDRQWGAFSQSGWDWFSLRMLDRSEMMMFDFPTTGYHDGTIISPDGTEAETKNFRVATTEWTTINGAIFGQEWTVEAPELGGTYRVVALSTRDYNPNRVMPYWEGLCKVYDDRGTLVGYAVEETTATAHPAGAS
jgi:predicted secreted hydrolase